MAVAFTFGAAAFPPMAKQYTVVLLKAEVSRGCEEWLDMIEVQPASGGSGFW
jgi:hypothetical protein